VALLLLMFTFRDGLTVMLGNWEMEEYSYAYLLPFIVLFLVWQKKELLEKIPFPGSWAGLALVVVGVALFFIGNLATLYIVIQYAFLLALAGLVLALTGWRGFRLIWVPLLILVFMVPLPSFLFNNLSAQLQLISSQIGVAVIRLFGISVYLQGNVIDLGVFKLQVVDACSGLRYLFPLMTLSFIAAYFFKGAFWKRALLFLSSIPITVLMNSFRIGLIGVTVDNWGPSMAEGVLHQFEGWVVFMSCTGVLIVEMWLLAKIGKNKMPLREAFGLDFPEPTPADAQVQPRQLPKSFVASIALLAVVAVLSTALPTRVEVPPQRQLFAGFPLQVGEWKGRDGRLDQIYIDALKFTDYAMIDYADRNRHGINFYVAYYASQRKGVSAHSPRSCIPGDGWVMSALTQLTIAGATVNGHPLQVNRVVIQKGDDRELVYYWFQQRGRVITNEYLVKWWLFWDALTRNRTDGAMIRLTTSVNSTQSMQAADERLANFARAVTPQLKAYVPD
jgi:exosortase D (VPLPA-CTERM-specific)